MTSVSPGTTLSASPSSSTVAPPSVRADWAETLGEDRLRALEADLCSVTPPDLFQLDVSRWFGTP
ncbi:MAG TPA: hypothetical protein VNS49_12905 [Streptomyces sp.]|nr:hypothetical protein [Streptomyces sp.]